MQYSFTKIEKDKTVTIGFVFSFLILFYFAASWLIVALGKSYVYSNDRTFVFQSLNLGQSVIVLGIALVIGYGHWSYATSNLIAKILGVLRAESLNPKDTYHQRLQNIVDEVSVVTGGTKMDPVVIPTMAINAFAVSDFSGRAVIGVTEGMLARLTRAQLEAVVGHEAAHIVTGDCLATTVTSSLFELYSGMLRGFEALFRGGGLGRRRYSSAEFRGGAQGAVFVILIYVLLMITKLLSQMVRLFISRQREYRADAIAVRLTRDPLSLAEALYAISYRWRGAGLPAQELEAIFTVNPVYSALDEQKGLWADMFSTHPPVEERIGILLNMAHADAESLIKEVERKAKRPRISAPQVNAASKEWLVQKDGEWKGPFTLAQLPALDWITPETWIQPVGGDKVKMVYEDNDVQHALYKTGVGGGAGYNCPRCQVALQPLIYEGVEVFQCGCCQGTLVGETEIQRIVIRQEVGFSERIQRIAEGIKNEERMHGTRIIARDPKLLFTCPHCRHVKAKMLRMFYTEVYRVEIDKCHTCGMIWFDKDELEAVQYLIEDAVEKV